MACYAADEWRWKKLWNGFDGDMELKKAINLRDKFADLPTILPQGGIGSEMLMAPTLCFIDGGGVSNGKF